ncbi:hypothetical protein KKB43_05825 [Patescibacteria group bacterium]|nr:hypothetical protein [Patescibacteria group bacterium]MBU4580502.1 hypothetical protein [Patescibacteria group bacterium]
MKIVLDFDDTIFNTGDWTEELINIFTEEGFFREEYEVNYWKSKEEKGDFDADFMIQLFSESKQINKDKIKKEIKSTINKSKGFVYKDFFDFAKSFNKKDLTLVSAGLKEIQMGKIENAGIVSFFGKISISLEYKSDEIELIVKKYPSEKIFFIDDKAKQIDEAKKRLPEIVAIKMERITGRHILPKSESADYIVKNLDEARVIINELNK